MKLEQTSSGLSDASEAERPNRSKQEPYLEPARCFEFRRYGGQAEWDAYRSKHPGAALAISRMTTGAMNMTDHAWVDVSCPQCGGDRRVSDPKCGGNGYRGMGDSCRSCDGTGLVECARCQGFGTVKSWEKVGW